MLILLHFELLICVIFVLLPVLVELLLLMQALICSNFLIFDLPDTFHVAIFSLGIGDFLMVCVHIFLQN